MRKAIIRRISYAVVTLGMLALNISWGIAQGGGNNISWG
jgi:hypothetical protein